MRKTLTTLISVSLFFALSGCGLHPLMKQPSPGTKQQVNLHVQGTGYLAYKMRRDLEKQLSMWPEVFPEPIHIEVAVSQEESSLASAIDATSARLQNALVGAYVLSKKGQEIGRGTAKTLTSFPVNSVDEFVTRSSQKAAVMRLTESLAMEISHEMMMALKKPIITPKN